MVSEDVPLDHRVHARIIGARGKAIRKIMDEFKKEDSMAFPPDDEATAPGLAVELSSWTVVGDGLCQALPPPWPIRGSSLGVPSSDIVRSFQVDIRFPQSGAPDPNCVTVTGLPENVEEAIDHILNLEEEYLADVVDTESLQVYMKAPAHEEAKAPSRGFVVRDAPWTASSSEKVRRGLLPPGSQGGWAGLASRGRQLRRKLLVSWGATLLKPCPLSAQAPDMSSSEEFPSFGAQVAPKTLPWGPKR
ncbi:hypothetical protein P7K49_013227 [Saguinus oedipus]|uniref:K Homology domain-containing protein n=1 Tax=Saguinus oedipus TaxID=9490 RepID=A0ABQ9VFB6_SAGOE|nr:hypothetical protein P7K49_013227 [Saguinus oedipus]